VNSEKYIGLDVHQATISVAVKGFPGQVNHGIHPGNQSVDHSGVYTINYEPRASTQGSFLLGCEV
jgi:hypothetical protein